MKTNLTMLILGVAILAAPRGFSEAVEVKPGDSLDTVKGILGEPRGSIAAGDYLLLTYDRGRVELDQGVVTSADLMPVEHFQAMQAQDRLAREEARRNTEERRVRLYAEGKTLLEEKRLDPGFQQRPTSDQVAYWRNFRAQYPDVNVDLEYADALGRYQQELAAMERELARSRELRDLEARVAEAERKAAEAEDRSRRNTGYYSSYPVYVPVYYSRPICNDTKPEPVRRTYAKKTITTRSPATTLEVVWGDTCATPVKPVTYPTYRAGNAAALLTVNR